MMLVNLKAGLCLLTLSTPLCGVVIPAIVNAAEVQSNQPVRVYSFEVLLDSKPIGTHRFEVSGTEGGAQSIRSDASFDVRFLGIPLYRYRHTAHEAWQAGCLKQLQSTTHDNGKDLSVQGIGQNGRMQVTRVKSKHNATVDLNDCISTYAYWNPQALQQQSALLNPQTGDVDKIKVEMMAEESLAVAGRQLIAKRFRLHLDSGDIDLWYSKEGEWLQLESVTEERRIRYRLQ